MNIQKMSHKITVQKGTDIKRKCFYYEENTEKPILAAVNGVAAGAGANIALACDVVLASENASFIQAFSKIGLVPDSAGTFFLPRLIGFQKASALCMLGDKVSALDAEKMGMIYKAIPAEDFEGNLQIQASESQDFKEGVAAFVEKRKPEFKGF